MAWAGVSMAVPFYRANRGHALVSSVLTGHKAMHVPTASDDATNDNGDNDDNDTPVPLQIEWPMLRAVLNMADLCTSIDVDELKEFERGWSFNLSSFVDTIFFQHEIRVASPRAHAVTVSNVPSPSTSSSSSH